MQLRTDRDLEFSSFSEGLVYRLLAKCNEKDGLSDVYRYDPIKNLYNI